MNRVIKTGVLSYGMSGRLFHCPFLNLHAGFELSAIVERTTKKANKVYPDVKSYDTIDAILNDSEIELIVINTPSSTHFEFALKALKAGKHLLVEKPFTVTSSEAKTLFLEAKKQNCHVMPFQNRRYDSDFLSVKDVVESGRLGNLIEVHFRYDRYVYDISNNQTKETAIPGNGILYNLGPHLVDAAIALFGKPLKWSKVTQANRPNSKIDDYAHVHLEYENGLQVFITASLLVADALPAFVLYGTKGAYIKKRCDVQEAQLQSGILPNHPGYGIEKSRQEGVLTTVANGFARKEKIISKKASYMNIFEAVFQTIRNGKPFPVSESQIIQQIEILEN
jgi:predicted dehydrogenase